MPLRYNLGFTSILLVFLIGFTSVHFDFTSISLRGFHFGCTLVWLRFDFRFTLIRFEFHFLSHFGFTLHGKENGFTCTHWGRRETVKGFAEKKHRISLLNQSARAPTLTETEIYIYTSLDSPPTSGVYVYVYIYIYMHGYLYPVQYMELFHKSWKVCFNRAAGPTFKRWMFW